MKQTPLLMIEDMASKTLDDIKTHTRRIIKGLESGDLFVETCDGIKKLDGPEIKCPYGGPGDRLWIKETHYRYGHWIKNGLTKAGRQRYKFKPLTDEVRYFDSAPAKLASVRQTGWHKRPSVFLPKLASRLTLEIVSIRAERIQDISADDAVSEGIDPSAIPGIGSDSSLINAFRLLWDSINAEREGGAYAWIKNPWVWVIEFRRLDNGRLH